MPPIKLKIPHNILLIHLLRIIILVLLLYPLYLYLSKINALSSIYLVIIAIFINEILKFLSSLLIYKFDVDNILIGMISSVIEGLIIIFILNYIGILFSIGDIVLALSILANAILFSWEAILIEAVIVGFTYFFINFEKYSITNLIYYLLQSLFILSVGILNFFMQKKFIKLEDMVLKKSTIKDSKSAEDVKDEFTIIASHNLRTPLAALRGYLQLLDGTDDDETRKNYLNLLKINVDKLSNIIEEIVGMLTIGDQTSDNKINIRIILTELIEGFREQVRPKNIHINLHYDEGVPDVNLNEYRIKIILKNIIDNAVKYSYNNANIDINVKSDVSDLIISIQDYGVGIDPEQLKNIFNKYHKTSDIMDTNFEGMGLGLYLVKNLLDIEMGKIEVRSEKGKGTEFILRFPINDVLQSLERK